MAMDATPSQQHLLLTATGGGSVVEVTCQNDMYKRIGISEAYRMGAGILPTKYDYYLILSVGCCRE